MLQELQRSLNSIGECGRQIPWLGVKPQAPKFVSIEPTLHFLANARLQFTKAKGGQAILLVSQLRLIIQISTMSSSIRTSTIVIASTGAIIAGFLGMHKLKIATPQAWYSEDLYTCEVLKRISV